MTLNFPGKIEYWIHEIYKGWITIPVIVINMLLYSWALLWDSFYRVNTILWGRETWEVMITTPYTYKEGFIVAKYVLKTIDRKRHLIFHKVNIKFIKYIRMYTGWITNPGKVINKLLYSWIWISFTMGLIV